MIPETEYEVTREIYKKCDKKWEVDVNFPERVKTDNVPTYLNTLYDGKIPRCKVSSSRDGSTVYTLSGSNAERYTFSRR